MEAGRPGISRLAAVSTFTTFVTFFSLNIFLCLTYFLRVDGFPETFHSYWLLRRCSFRVKMEVF